MRHEITIPRKLRCATTSDNTTWRGIVFARRRMLSGCLLTLLAVMLPLSSVLSSVLVAPTVVVLSDQQRTGRMILRNPTDVPQEVSVEFKFGLPISDSLGNLTLTLEDSAVTDPRSALGWIRAFPRRIVMPPGAEQTVRFVARPPKDLPEGEYWSRIVVSSQRSQPPQLDKVKEGVISARLNTIIQTAISLKYRKGDLNARVEMTGVDAIVTDSTVSVLVDMVNRGNVSYLGVLHTRLIDADGNEIEAKRENTAVYYDLRRRVDFRLPEGELAEPMKVEISVTTEGRRDVPAKDVVPGNAVDYSLVLE
ncbi:hypothetical protein GF377_09675 [candidate division GN15 bacterium]|nr:hypothetical protein [candidate division GN15 bacterium]